MTPKHKWLEIYWPRQSRPSIQGLDRQSRAGINRIVRAVRALGGECHVRTGVRLPDREGR